MIMESDADRFDREVIRLRGEEKSYAQICEYLGIGENQLRVICRRLLRRGELSKIPQSERWKRGRRP